MTVNLVEDKSKCSGCSACLNICPVHAISMEEDGDGFLYPNISSARCIECRQCLQVCPYKNKICSESLQESYAAIGENIDLKESSSGGLFPSIAINFIRNKGIVYGCSMQYENEEIAIKHVRIDAEDDLKKLKGSKYVQSDMGLTYRSVKEDLQNGFSVLFSGTPCQVAGLYAFLRGDYPTLYTIDIICHGVPSQKFFHSYIQFEETSRNMKIQNFVFRDKSEGWRLYGRMDGVKNEAEEKIYFEAEDSSYYQLFLDKYTYRDSCYKCPYASKHRPGNITLADYWNIELVHPELVKENGGIFDTDKGISALVVNNSKGQELIKYFGQNIKKFSSSYENASRYNYQFIQPSKEPEGRSRMFEDFKNGYEIIDKKYKSQLRKKKLKRRIRASVPAPIKKAVRAIRSTKI